MLFVIYSPPSGAAQRWDDLRLGTICDALEWDYTKRFCGAGTFSLTIPRTSLFAQQIEIGCILMLTNKDEAYDSVNKYEGFIVKDILRKNDTIKITGYDLNGLLLDRLTLAETQDGKDAQSGATETIVKHYVTANCVESADADRNFPGLEAAEDKGRGLVNDAASPRLSRVSDVVNDILGAAGMGYRIYPGLNRADKPAIVFEVLEETNRTDEQSENPRVIFAYGHGNITELTRETGVTADRNTFYCEYNGGYVTRYDKKSGDGESGEEQGAKYSGYGRREEFLELSCELPEVEVYAEHEIADRYRETDSLEIVAGNPLDYGRVYNVGDIATVYDRDRKVKLNSVISAVEIKKTATEYTVNITLGDAKPKPLDLLGKSGGAVATVIRQDVSVISSRVASYEYLSDVSVKYNGVTYTVEKNENGLISKISDDMGNSFKPTISGEITDIPLHNAVFWAVAMHGGLNKQTYSNVTLFSGETGELVYGGGITGFIDYKESYQNDSRILYYQKSNNTKTMVISESCGLNEVLDGYTNAFIAQSKEPIDLTPYKTLRITAKLYTNWSGLTVRAYFNVGQPPKPQQHQEYNFDGWAFITESNQYGNDTDDSSGFQVYTIDISGISGVQYLNLAVYHGTEIAAYSGYFDILKMTLEL